MLRWYFSCIGSMGNVRTKTMRAWSEAEFAKLLSEGHDFEKGSAML